MDKSVFSEEWIKNFKIVFGGEAEIILDKIEPDLGHLMDILYEQSGHLSKLLNLESVAKQIEKNNYELVAMAYYKTLLIPELIEEVIILGKNPNRVK